MLKNKYEYAYQHHKAAKLFLLKALLLFVILFIVIQFVFLYIIKPFHISTTDMSPQINTNDVVFVLPKSEKRPGIFNSKSIKRGDIVILKNTNTKQNSAISNLFSKIATFVTFEKYVSQKDTNKGLYRVIGMPGDSIYMKDYILYIKEQGEAHFLTEYEIVKKNYNLEINQIPKNWNKNIGVPGNTTQLVLSKNEYFVLCDNRVTSIDSRFFGPIKNERIAGKVICRYFPFSAISIF